MYDIPKLGDDILISHILLECRKIFAITEKIDFTTYLENTLYQDALIRPLENIGEAAGNLSSEFAEMYPQIPVHELRSLRNVLAHQYYRVDIEYIWMSVTLELPKVYQNILAIEKYANK